MCEAICSADKLTLLQAGQSVVISTTKRVPVFYFPLYPISPLAGVDPETT